MAGDRAVSGRSPPPASVARRPVDRRRDHLRPRLRLSLLGTMADGNRGAGAGLQIAGVCLAIAVFTSSSRDKTGAT